MSNNSSYVENKTISNEHAIDFGQVKYCQLHHNPIVATLQNTGPNLC